MKKRIKERKKESKEGESKKGERAKDKEESAMKLVVVAG